MLQTSARRPLALAYGAVAVALCLLLTGCSGSEEKAAPPPSPTPIAELNTVTMQVPRIEFCSLVPDSAVSDALGGKPASDAAYGNGDEEELPGVGADVVHELGCRWDGDDGVSARAWVFARPINTEFARSVIASGRRTPGCRTVPGSAYGQPSATQVCAPATGERRVRHSGLFGQTWLTCELAATGLPQAELRSRADSWCVEIANALNTAR